MEREGGAQRLGQGQGQGQEGRLGGEAVEADPGIEDAAGRDGGEGFVDSYYGGMVPNHLPTPESAVYGAGWVPSSSFMADLTSWGQFDSLVTAGVGMMDGGGFVGDAGFGFGMGM